MAGGEQSLAVGHCAVDTGRSGDTSALPRCRMKHRTPLVRCPAHLLYEAEDGAESYQHVVETSLVVAEGYRRHRRPETDLISYVPNGSTASMIHTKSPLCKRPRPIPIGAATNVPLGLRLHTSLL